MKQILVEAYPRQGYIYEKGIVGTTTVPFFVVSNKLFFLCVIQKKNVSLQKI